MSRGIWVISNGFSKQKLANHVAKLETLTFCLQKLFWQYELSVSLGASERQARRDKDNFCLSVTNFALSVNVTGMLRQYLLLVYKLSPQRKLWTPNSGALSTVGPTVELQQPSHPQGIHKLPAWGSSGHVRRQCTFGGQINSPWNNWYMGNCCSK